MTLEVPPNFNRIPLPLLTINKLALLEKSTNTPPFYILIEGTNVVNDVVFYDIELCLQDDKNAVLNRITRRFSQIEKFHQAIKKVLEPKIKLPKLPPKKIFGTTNADFIKERKDALQAYFNFYPTVQRIVFVEIFQVFFELINMEKIKKDPDAVKRVEQERVLMNLTPQ